MDTKRVNEFDLENTETAKEQRAERRKLWFFLYILMAVVALVPNIFMLNVIFRNIGGLASIEEGICKTSLPFTNNLYFVALAWLGERLKFKIITSLIVMVAICLLSIAASYLIVAV